MFSRTIGAMHCLRNVTVHDLHDLGALTLATARDTAQAATPGELRAARLRAAKVYIVENSFRRDVSVAAIANHLGVTPRTLQRLFEADGTTFSTYLLCQRLARAHAMLSGRRFSDSTVSSVAYDAGFGDLSYFNRCFRKFYGTTPRKVRQAGSRSREETAPAVRGPIGV
jgi:AraC-like DNA-binding protein